MNLWSLYFSRGGQVVRLPHNPEKLPETKDADNGSYNVLGIGPIMVPRTPKLRVLEISNYFPASSSSSLFSLLTTRAPEYYINFFQSAMDEKEPILYTPVRINERGIPYATSLLGYYVLVTKFKHEERGGETGDFYYELECTEYRDYSPSKVQTVATAAASSSSASTVSSALTTVATAAAVVGTAVAAVASTALAAMVEPTRATPSGQLVVGSTAELTGSYYMDSSKGGPSQPASGVAVKVVRIESGDLPSPVYVKGTDGTRLGWVEKSSLTGVKNDS